MVKDAENHASEDKARKEIIEAKNHADSLIYSTEKSLKEYSDKISDTDKSAIENAVTDLKASLEKDDVEDIKSKTEALSNAAMKLGEAMYQAPQGEAEDASDSSDKKDDGKVVDAEFEDLGKKE
jgi:molecular chaperone DnaK